VTAIRRGDRDGYDAIQLAADPVTPEDKLTKAELGHLKKAGAPAMREVVEFRDAEIGSAGQSAGESDAEGRATRRRMPEMTKVGDEVTVASFEPGQRVKVSAVSRARLPGNDQAPQLQPWSETHGSHNVRAPRLDWGERRPCPGLQGMKMPGQMGARRVTQRGAHVVEIDAERNLLLIRGSVPGGENATVEVRSDG
jgi:large subunit ribosomal protein L3